MAEGGWVVLGTLIGATGSVVSTFIADYLRNRREDRLDEARKKLLRTMLEDRRFQWRNLATLSHVVGADENITKRLLLEINARASEDGASLWGLISRNPFPNST